MDLLIVGSIALDSVETPTHRREELLGGSASYASVAAARFASTGVVAVVGDDFPAEYRSLLADQGVDVDGIEVVPGRSFRWSGRYFDDMNRRETISTELGVFEDFQPKLPESARQARCVFLGNIHPRLQLDVLEQSEGAEIVALDTMNYWIEGTPEDLARVLERIQILLVNDEEARLLSGESSLLAAARKIRAMGPSHLVIKRGEYGALLIGDGELFHVPGMLLEDVVDPTGAGDTFAGGFMGYLASKGTMERRTLREAMVMGTVMASFLVQGFSLEALVKADAEAIGARRAMLLDMTQL